MTDPKPSCLFCVSEKPCGKTAYAGSPYLCSRERDHTGSHAFCWLSRDTHCYSTWTQPPETPEQKMVRLERRIEQMLIGLAEVASNLDDGDEALREMVVDLIRNVERT